MITDHQYEAITGDTAPDNFENLRDFAIRKLEAALGRKLRSAERTEVHRVTYDGWVYVTASPVTACDTASRFGGDRIYVGRHLYGSEVSITYTGGYADYEAGEAHDLPVELAEAIAWAVHTLENPQAPPVPSGMSSINIAGEASAVRTAVGPNAGAEHGDDGIILPSWASALRSLGGRCAQLADPWRRMT